MVYKLMKWFTADLMKNTWYEDMPNVDRIFNLLNNIYIARAARLYELEENLYAMLIFIMRTRELAIIVTRLHPEDEAARLQRFFGFSRNPSLLSIQSDPAETEM